MATGTGLAIRGDVKVIRRTERLRRAVDDLRTIHRRIGIELVKWGIRNFQRQGIERRWPPLAASTVFGRRKKSRAILQNTGKLRQSFAHFRATSRGVRWGSIMDIAKYHHEGTKPYTIKPKTKKVLAFPHPGGTQTSAGPGMAKAGGRSKREFGNLTFLAVKKVEHPGLKPRPLLPSRFVAQGLARKTVDLYIKQHNRP